LTLVQATAVDHCNIKVNKHFTSDIPAVLRQLHVIETQRCENLAIIMRYFEHKRACECAQHANAFYDLYLFHQTLSSCVYEHEQLL
jgi:hypothetical protein